MKFATRGALQRRSQPQSLWEIAETYQRNHALRERYQRQADNLRSQLDKTRHDSKNWVASARRLMHSQHTEQVMECLDALALCLDPAPIRARGGLRSQLCQLRRGWRAGQRHSVILSIAISPTLPEHHNLNDTLLSLADNLVRNALSATQRGMVRLQLWQHRDGVCLRVADTGPGFTHTSTAGGWGLGLAIMREQVERQRGYLQVSSKTGVICHAWLPLENAD